MARKPQPFMLCFNEHQDDGRRVWAVKVNDVWKLAREVSCLVPTLTVYMGPKGRQPRAFLVGEGVVSRKGDTLVITP
jgi:hypothetical protein